MTRAVIALSSVIECHETRWATPKIAQTICRISQVNLVIGSLNHNFSTTFNIYARGWISHSATREVVDYFLTVQHPALTVYI